VALAVLHASTVPVTIVRAAAEGDGDEEGDDANEDTGEANT
jgi:hypothetical protein